MREAQKAAMPSTVKDMLPVIEYIRQQQEEQELTKALSKPNVIPFPSRAIEQKKPGMQSVYLDERRIQLLGDYYEPPGNFGFDMMRAMVDQTPILAGVILTRQRQVQRFCRVQESGKGPGFAIRLKCQSMELGDAEKKSIELLQSFFINCGWETNPRKRKRLRRDNFSTFMMKQLRDSLILDSAPIETEWKRNRSLGLDGFYAVDGATIRLCNEDGYNGDDEIFALQVVQGNLRAAYTYDDLIYEPRNPRSDVLVGGYGMSETELLIKVVTGLLNAMSYNMKFFDNNTIPKGMLHLSGDYSQEDINAFKRYWNAMVRGINNAWTLPIMVSKNQESKASFEKFGVDISDVMFEKWMLFLTSVVCAIYGMAPEEINMDSFHAGNTSALSGSDTEETLIHSKDKGLRPLLAHFENVFSDYIVAEFGDKYVFRWTGLDELTQEQAWIEEKALCTLNEARKARGMEELEWGDCPLEQTTMGAYMQSIQPQGDGGDEGEDGGSNATELFRQLGIADDDDQDGEQDKSGGDDEQLAKAFGLPVFRIEP